jgi:signal transduction histidine kinase
VSRVEKGTAADGRIATMRDGTRKLRRQYLAAATIFAALLIATFVLFGHLLLRQFSRSYLEDMLVSGKAQAAEVAKQMSGGGSLYKVVEHRKETLQRITAALAYQDAVEFVQVFDERGKLVWQTTTKSEGYLGGFPDANADLLLPSIPKDVVETQHRYEIHVPLEDYGTVVLALSKPVLADRVAVLRRRLLLNTAAAGGLALVVLSGAVGFIWHLVQRNAGLEQRRRMDEELAALGSLAANLAHEIRNPLNALSLNLELLEEDLASHRDEVETARLARQEVGRLSRLVNDFLVYARPQPPVLEACRADEVLREVARLLQPVCDRGGVALAVDAEPVRLRADRAQLGQVIVNLALNAVQAMDDGPRKQIELRARRDREEVLIEVVDSGPGIPEEELERVREAFYSRRRGGTGLGLAIAERVVRGHNGRLVLENREEGGLIARVVLSPAPEPEG